MANKTKKEIDCKECPAEKEGLWWLVFECSKYPGKRFPCPSWDKHFGRGNDG